MTPIGQRDEYRTALFLRAAHRSLVAASAVLGLSLVLARSLVSAQPASPAGQPAKSSSNASNPNPVYLSGMPPVERVKSEIQGTSPADTLARQMAVFTILEQIVIRLPGPARMGNSQTPDESKIMQSYRSAAYELSQQYAKSHTPQEVKDLTARQGRYETTPALADETFNKLLSPAVRDQYAKADAAWAARNQARADADRQAASQQAQAARASGNSPFVRNDPGTLAARRCVELGGTELECVGKGLMTGFLGSALSDLAGVKKSERPGLTMTGRYQAQGSFNLSFGGDAVVIDGCGKLVATSFPYAVVKNGNRWAITLQANPQPIAFSLGPDRMLAGPALTDLNGRIVTGYRRVWMQEYRNGSPVVGGACAGACGYWTQEPIYAPKTERCSVGALRPAGPSATGSLSNAISDAVSALPGGPTARTPERDLPAPGPRMAGHYAGQGGLALEFSTESIILDCGEAHVPRPYTVENSTDQVLVHVTNSTTPFTLALKGDGTLTGSGSADVAGRVVTGSNDTGLIYGPRRARCTVGVLLPNATPGAAVTSRTSPATPISGATTNSDSGVLSLTSGFPAQPGYPSPLNGLSIYLLKESFVSIAAKNGIRAAAGKSAVQSWGAACDQHAPECAKVMNAIPSSAEAQLKLDMDGKGSFPVMPSGTYHLLAWMPYDGHHLVWDVQIEIKPGAPAFVVDQRSAIPVN
jgi:hypothetical protein